MGRLGDIYANGFGVARDYAQALFWYSKVGDKGDPKAQVDVGIIYENGMGVTRDYATAMAWYQKAAG